MNKYIIVAYRPNNVPQQIEVKLEAADIVQAAYNSGNYGIMMSEIVCVRLDLNAN